MLAKNKILILLSIASLIYLISCFVYFTINKNTQLEKPSKTSLKNTTAKTYDSESKSESEPKSESESTQLGTTVDTKKEYLVFDDIFFTMEKSLRKGGQVELKLIKTEGRNQYEIYIKKNVAK